MLILAMVFTVLLLIWMGFFMMGSLPLLILKHDTPLDARFVRGLFNVYYTAVIATAAIGALSYMVAGRPIVALAFGTIATVSLAARIGIVPRMDALRNTMTADDAAGIRRFRQLHVAGMLLNVALLAVLCACMVQLKL